MSIRLQTFLARADVASRRKAEAIIASGRVKVNGSVVLQKGYGVDPDRDRITFDGKMLSFSEKEYYILNKPKGYISTVRDPYAQRIVIDLITKKRSRLYPVGRLDKNTTGILLMTNDGRLAHRLTHPSFEIKKIYTVKAKGSIRDDALLRLEKGVMLDGALTAPCSVRHIDRSGKTTELDIEIHEGKKRQIRRMFEAIGHPVLSLKRIAFAGMKLGSLKEGSFRKLTGSEVAKLKRILKLR